MKIIRPVHLILAGLVLLLLASCGPAALTPSPTSFPVPSLTPSPSPLSPTAAPEGLSVSGVVLSDPDGVPLAGATVRIRTTGNARTTDSTGHFTLSGLATGESVSISAWVSGYAINGVAGVLPGAANVEILLRLITEADNPDYAWQPSIYHEGQGENQGCAQCHSAAATGLAFLLPVDEWLLDAHAQSTVNPRFMTMYTGSDVNGNRSPLTQYALSRDYGRFPLPPDLTQPYFGPGYKLDFPDTAGNCAACHVPVAAIDTPYDVDPAQVSGVAAEGIPCDFCHKVWDVRLDAATGLPASNMPGVLSFEFRRPLEGAQFFAGPFDDVFPGEDTYSPIQRQGQFCAPCHYGVFWDTQVYNSFGEWLASPYSAAGIGKTCQDCHMPHGNATSFARPDQGGTLRDPQTIFSHLMPGASSTELLQNAVTMTVNASRQGDQITVEVTILNDRTGHDVPTDSPLRQVLLLVQAAGPDGGPLVQVDGPRLPDWAGVGNPAQGYYAGLPGKAYARILEELWTGVSPTGAYWNPTRVVSDNRLPALGSDTSTCTFTAPAGGSVTINVSLLYRRAFIQLMDWKGWDMPDIVMDVERVEIP